MSSSRLPAEAVIAAETSSLESRRRRRLTWAGAARGSVPYALILTLIVWAGIPFVVITVYAGLAQVPGELLDAAATDGASSLRVFRDVTLPILKPILLILTSLSIIWDFGVFTQPYLLIRPEHLHAS